MEIMEQLLGAHTSVAGGVSKSVPLAEKLGFKLEKIQITRSRRSGIRRSFKLRETITYLRKVK